MAASMFMNSNSLPIALMQSLVLSVNDLKWTPDDNKNAMLGRALTYLVLYSTLGMMVRFVNSDTVLVLFWDCFALSEFDPWVWEPVSCLKPGFYFLPVLACCAFASTPVPNPLP